MTKLPAIIYTVQLQPFINKMDKDDKFIRSYEVDELPKYIRNVILIRINNDYDNIISKTLSYQYKVSGYEYDKDNNKINIDFVIMPVDIMKYWIPESVSSPLPQNETELITSVRNNITDQVNQLYGDLSKSTWKSDAELTFYTDKDDIRYDIDLRLINVDNFIDWNIMEIAGNYKPSKMNIELEDYQPELEESTQNGGYHEKYLKYKTKYLLLKKKKDIEK